MSPVLCFDADDETAKAVETLRIAHTEKGDLVLRPRSEVLLKLIKRGLEDYDTVTDVERETSFPAYPTTVRSVSHTRDSKRNAERSTRKSAKTVDSK